MEKLNLPDTNSPTIYEVQQQVHQWIQDIGVRYFNEMTNLAQLVEEVGEVSRLISRTYGEQSFKKGKEPQDIKEELASEFADVLFVLVCLANQTGVDLTDALQKSLDKKTKRDKTRHQENQKLK